MNKRTNLKIRLVILVVLAVLPGKAFATGTYDGGDGSEGDPFQINTAAQMDEIGQHSEDWGSYFILTADINLSGYTGTSFHIISPDTDGMIGHQGAKFTGVFDGNGHSISNFTYDSIDTDYIGLFGFVEDADAVIKDVTLFDPNVKAGTGEYVGALVGYVDHGSVTGCSVQGGSVVSGKYWVGGLVGELDRGDISNCCTTGSVSGDYVIGGLVGINCGDISNCRSTSTVSGDGGVGGLLGENYDNISNCCSTGSVSGVFNVGGLAGASYDCDISNCYATGSVSGDDDYAGGLVGWYDCGHITNCYAAGPVNGKYNTGGLLAFCICAIHDSFWDVNTTGQQTSSGGGTGKTTAEMHQQATFVSWDFNTPVWEICEGTNYPKLAWQIPILGDFVCPDGVEFRDFAILAAQWLNVPGEPSADIAPVGMPDSIVDWRDLEVFTDNWLAGK